MRAEREPFPQLIPPMLAASGPMPVGAEEAGWAWEFKWDGVRAVTYVRLGGVVLRSRNDRDITVSYPELHALGAALPTPAVLDGELVAFDEAGRPSFGTLQRRMHVSDPAAAGRLSAQVPVSYVIFDILHLDGWSLRSLPYDARREHLTGLGLDHPAWQVPAHYGGGGHDILAASRANGLEGVIGKRLDSVYRPGRRADTWRKVKNVRMQEVVVGGWKAGAGRREGGLGSLLVGVPAGGGLDYVGRVGTGFSDRALASLLSQLRQREQPTSPFAAVPAADAKGARWVQPTLVGEVTFGEWTRDGRLRHPSWRGLRPDKSPEEVTRAGE